MVLRRYVGTLYCVVVVLSDAACSARFIGVHFGSGISKCSTADLLSPYSGSAVMVFACTAVQLYTFDINSSASLWSVY